MPLWTAASASLKICCADRLGAGSRNRVAQEAGGAGDCKSVTGPKEDQLLNPIVQGRPAPARNNGPEPLIEQLNLESLLRGQRHRDVKGRLLRAAFGHGEGRRAKMGARATARPMDNFDAHGLRGVVQVHLRCESRGELSSELQPGVLLGAPGLTNPHEPAGHGLGVRGARRKSN